MRKNGMKREILRSAFLRSLPVLAGYVLIGFGFGMVLRDAGFGLGWALAMSLLIYAGSMQYVGVSLLAAPAGLLTTLLTTVMINGRHLFYSISMIGRYRDMGKYKPYLIFALTDETYALLSDDSLKGQPPVYYFLVSLLNQGYWMAGTALGSLLAAALPFDTSGVEFSMTALFVAAYTEQWSSGTHRGPAALGLAVTLVCRLLLGRDLFLIPAMGAITLILLLAQPRKEADHEA